MFFIKLQCLGGFCFCVGWGCCGCFRWWGWDWSGMIESCIEAYSFERVIGMKIVGCWFLAGPCGQACVLQKLKKVIYLNSFVGINQLAIAIQPTSSIECSANDDRPSSFILALRMAAAHRRTAIVARCLSLVISEFYCIYFTVFYLSDLFMHYPPETKSRYPK